jgi:hypothetical protein
VSSPARPVVAVRVRVDDDGCRLLELDSVVLVLGEVLERCEDGGDPLTPARELLAGLRRLRDLPLPEAAPASAIEQLEARLRERIAE